MTTVRKAVSFDSSKDSIKPIERLEDMSPTEISRIWIQPEELASIQIAFKSTVRKMIRGRIPTDTTDESPRGLERWVPKHANKWDRVTQRAVEAVLKEQRRQAAARAAENDARSSRRLSPEQALAKVYREKAAKSLEHAHQVGLKDEKQAKLVHLDGGNKFSNGKAFSFKEQRPLSRLNSFQFLTRFPQQ